MWWRCVRNWRNFCLCVESLCIIHFIWVFPSRSRLKGDHEKRKVTQSCFCLICWWFRIDHWEIGSSVRTNCMSMSITTNSYCFFFKSDLIVLRQTPMQQQSSLASASNSSAQHSILAMMMTIHWWWWWWWRRCVDAMMKWQRVELPGRHYGNALPGELQRCNTDPYFQWWMRWTQWWFWWWLA